MCSNSKCVKNTPSGRTISQLPCWCENKGRDPVTFHRASPNFPAHLTCYNCGKQKFKEDEIEEYFTHNYTENRRKGKKRMNVAELTEGPNKQEHLPKWDAPLQFPKDKKVALIDRSISQDAAIKYATNSWFLQDGSLAARSFDYTLNGEVIAQKFKNKFKSQIILNKNPEEKLFNSCELFGQDKFPKGCSKIITVVEGEEDALACWDILQASSKSGAVFENPVVSIPSGASSAKTALKRNWEYLNSFEEIRICFDADEPGNKAAEECAELFPKKAKVVRLDRFKDANEYLKHGAIKEFMAKWWKPESVAPPGIIPSSSLWDSMTEVTKNTTVPFPWKGLNEYLYGMRTGELIVYKAFPKIGKTAVCRELAYHIKTNSEHNVGLIFLEETTKRIGLGLCSLDLNKPLQVPDTEYTLEELSESFERVLGSDRFVIFDPKADRSVDNVFAKMLQFVKAYDCKYLILDHISMLAYASGDEYERKFLDKLSADIKDFTVEHDVHIAVVTHVNDEGKTRGSRALYQLCDGLIDLKRDKLNPDKIKANTLELVIEENRISGECGLAAKLYYNRETGRLEELEVDEEQKQTYNQSTEHNKEVSFDD